jgi:hypothetical protein
MKKVGNLVTLFFIIIVGYFYTANYNLSLLNSFFVLAEVLHSFFNGPL